MGVLDCIDTQYVRFELPYMAMIICNFRTNYETIVSALENISLATSFVRDLQG
jgi:hypothetical protein